MDTLKEIEELEKRLQKKLQNEDNKKCMNCEKEIKENYFECVIHDILFCSDCALSDTFYTDENKHTYRKLIDCHKFIINDMKNCIMERRLFNAK